MSQVRKFEEGGKADEKTKGTAAVVAPAQPAVTVVPGMEAEVVSETPAQTTPNSYLIWDGEKIENNAENRQKLRTYLAQHAAAAGGSPWFDQIIKIANEAAETGRSLSYDSISNEFRYLNQDGSGVPIDWDGMNDRQDNRIQKQRSWLGRVLDAGFDSKTQRMARDLAKLRGFSTYLHGGADATGAGSSTAADVADLLGVDWGGHRFFSYLKDQDGNFVRDANGNLKYDTYNTTNTQLMRLLNRAKSYLKASEQDRKKYKLADEYNGGEDLLSIYNSNPDTWTQQLDGVIAKVTSGQQLSPEDMSFLALFGIDLNSPEGQAATKDRQTKEAWKKNGLESIYEKGKDWFEVNDDGELILNDAGLEALAGAGISKTGGYELNDQWLNYLKTKGIDSTGLDWLNGYTIYNGRIYKTSDGALTGTKLNNILNSSGFIGANQANEYAKAQQIINTFWGNPYDWNRHEDGYYSGFLYDPDVDNGTDENGNVLPKGAYRSDRYYRSANGMFNGVGAGKQIVAYYDPDSERDYQGFVTNNGIKYAITDAYGDVVADDLSEEDLTGMGITRKTRKDSSVINFGDEENTAFNQRRIYGSEDPRLNGHTMLTFGANNEYGIYYNPTKQATLHDPTSWAVFKSPEDGKGYVIPPSLWNALFQKENGVYKIQEILNNKQKSAQFIKLLKQVQGSNFWQSSNWKGNVAIFLPEYNAQLKARKICNFLGLDRSMYKMIKAELEEMQESGNKSEKQRRYTVDLSSLNGGDQVAVERQGGNIPKFAPGGGFGSTKKDKDSIEMDNEEVTDHRRPGTVKDLVSGKTDKLTDSDWIDLGALALDLTSIAAGSAPIAGGAVGAAGSTAGFIADIKRDGFQGRDAVTYGMSLLGDAVSILPLLGSGVQAAKAVAKIGKYIKPLLKFANYYGIGNAAATAIKRASEGKPLTIQDLRVIAVGLAGGINSYKMGFKNGTKKVEGDVTLKNTDKNFKEFDELTFKPKEANPLDTSVHPNLNDVKDIKFTKEEVAAFNQIKDPAERLAAVRQSVIQKGRAANEFGTDIKDDAIYKMYEGNVNDYFSTSTTATQVPDGNPTPFIKPQHSNAPFNTPTARVRLKEKTATIPNPIPGGEPIKIDRVDIKHYNDMIAAGYPPEIAIRAFRITLGKQEHLHPEWKGLSDDEILKNWDLRKLVDIPDFKLAKDQIGWKQPMKPKTTTTTKITKDFATTKFKVAGEEIKLTPKELKTINSGKTAEAKEKALVEVLKKKTRDDTLTLEKAQEMWDLSDFYKDVRHFKILHPKDSWAKVSEFQGIDPEMNIQAIPSTGKGFKDWWNGVGMGRDIMGRNFNRSSFNTDYPLAFVNRNPQLIEAGKAATTSAKPSRFAKIKENPNFAAAYNNWKFGQYIPLTPLHLGNYTPYADDSVVHLNLAPKHYGDDQPVPGVYTTDVQNYSNPYSYLYFKNGGRMKKKIRKAEDGEKITKSEPVTTTDTPSGGAYNPMDDFATQTGEFLAGNILNVAELLKLLKTKHDSRKIRDYTNEMYDSYGIAGLSPLHNFMYQDNGLEQQKNAAMNQQLNNLWYLPQTNDAMMNSIQQQAAYNSVANTGTKYDLAENQQLNTYNTKQQQLDYQQQVQQAKEAVSKITALNQILTAKGNNDIQFMTAASKGDDNYLTSEITKGNASAQALNKIAANEAYEAARTNDPRYASMKAAWDTYYKANPTKTMSDWFETDDGKKYRDAYIDIETNAQKAKNDVLKSGYYQRAGIFYSPHNKISLAAKGGTVTKKSSSKKSSTPKDYREQLVLDNNKAVAASIKQLNDQTKQILLKFLK